QEGTRNPGIYKISARNWTICLATQGNVRPKTFATKAGSGLALQTLERTAGKPSMRPGRSASPAPPQVARSSPPTAAPPPAPPTALEGEWTMVSATFGGAPLAPDMVKWCRRVTRGDITTVTAGPQTMLSARFTLDGSASPGRIDYVNLAGAQKGKR